MTYEPVWARTIIVPRCNPAGGYLKTLWYLDRSDGRCYTRGETTDMTKEFHEAEVRVREMRNTFILELLSG